MTPRTLNRLKLIGIGVLSALPVIASYLFYWFWTPQQHTNYGTLVDPPQLLPEVELRMPNGEALVSSGLRGRWILVAIDSGRCGPRCQEKLWQMRQVRLAQGKEMNRIERVWLIDDDQPADEKTVQTYAGLWLGRSTRAIVAALPVDTSLRDHVYLVDPLGNVMLRFPRDAEPKRMINDITRLLKYSGTG